MPDESRWPADAPAPTINLAADTEVTWRAQQHDGHWTAPVARVNQHAPHLPDVPSVLCCVLAWARPADGAGWPWALLAWRRVDLSTAGGDRTSWGAIIWRTAWCDVRRADVRQEPQHEGRRTIEQQILFADVCEHVAGRGEVGWLAPEPEPEPPDEALLAAVRDALADGPLVDWLRPETTVWVDGSAVWIRAPKHWGHNRGIDYVLSEHGHEWLVDGTVQPGESLRWRVRRRP